MDCNNRLLQEPKPAPLPRVSSPTTPVPTITTTGPTSPKAAPIVPTTPKKESLLTSFITPKKDTKPLAISGSLTQSPALLDADVRKSRRASLSFAKKTSNPEPLPILQNSTSAKDHKEKEKEKEKESGKWWFRHRRQTSAIEIRKVLSLTIL